MVQKEADVALENSSLPSKVSKKRLRKSRARGQSRESAAEIGSGSSSEERADMTPSVIVNERVGLTTVEESSAGLRAQTRPGGSEARRLIGW